jgi:hypothetical protein
MITGRVTGVEQVVQKLNSAPKNVKSRLETVITRLSINLQGYVVSQKLSGQVLKRQTGHLAGSIDWKVEVTEGGVIGTVGSRVKERNPLKYAAVHEYGFQGPVSVKEHLRKVTTSFGKQLKQAEYQTVQAHTRQMNVPERSFLRSSLRENAENIRQAISKAVAEGAKQ